ncbi:MAG: PAS domain S-box protein, partial [Longimicrobiales bacterium]
AWAVDFCAAAAEAGRDHDFEYRAIAADGSIHWLHDRVGVIRDEDGRPQLLRGVMIDVTQRRGTEEALRRSEAELAAAEAHYRRLVENAPYAIYALDRDGRFTELNQTAAVLLGRSPAELIGHSITEVVVPEDLPKAAESLRKKLSGELETSDIVLRLLSRTGETRQLHIRATVIREGGVITGTHGIARDITDDMEREQHLRRAERLASLGTLIGGVAHELNNPLHAIRSFAELMLQDARRPDDREGLTVIHREALRASRVVADFRLIARETQDAASAARRPVDVNDIVRHVITLRRYALDTSNIVLRVDLARDLPLVLADRAQLEQVLLNLVINAEQAMRPQPVKRLVLRTRSSSEGASIHVVDSGTGIPRSHLDRIFDPFFTTKAPGEGTGLGLALVHSIITEHDGQIHVDSEPDQGTAFRIDLPACPATTPNTDATDTCPTPRRRLHILVVDDEASIRQVFARYLTRRGHTVVAAGDGSEALVLIDQAEQQDGFDVILSDLRMPGLSGEQLLERLRAERPGIEKRLIFLTGDAVGGDAVRILATTDVPVLYKPIDLEEVALQIERTAEEAGALSR